MASYVRLTNGCVIGFVVSASGNSCDEVVGGRFEDYYGDDAVGPLLVVLEVGVEVNKFGPEAFTFVG